MNRSLVVAVVALFLSLGVNVFLVALSVRDDARAHDASTDGTGSPVDGGNTERREVNSLIQLLASPEHAEPEHVVVMGYLCRGFESDALYLGKEDCDRMLTSNAAYVDLPRDGTLDNVGEGYVLVEATAIPGRCGSFGGCLSRVVRIVPVPSRSVAFPADAGRE